MRHIAWLNAVPQAAPVSVPGRRAAPAAANAQSRLQKLQDAGVQHVPLPPVGPAGQALLAHLFEVGPVAHGGMGPVPISFSEIAAWQQLTGVPLQPWEAQLLRRLSREYVAEHSAASSNTRPPPWVAAEASVDQRQAVSRQISLGLRAMALAQQQKARQ